MVTIGPLELGEKPLLLAPMENITDPSFREICKVFGADMMYTEFISSDELIRKKHSAFEKLRLSERERPMGIQLYGHIPDHMAEAVRIAEEFKPDLIDLNFGCPARKIARRGAGAGMLRDVPRMLKITGTVVKNASVPVTVKTRLGWDENSKNIVEIALGLQEVGIKAITIHGRTGTQMYQGKADWTLIAEVKNHPGINIPVFGNGDIDSPSMAYEMFSKFSVDGIMIGRGSIGQPWIFRDTKTYLKTGTIPPPPDAHERIRIARLHFLLSLEYKKEPRGILEMRRFFIQYFKDLIIFPRFRHQLLTSPDKEKILDLLRQMELHSDVIS